MSVERWVAVSQFDNTNNILILELSSGRGQIAGAADLAEDRISFGVFEIEKNNGELFFIALIATPAGPALFFKDIQYRLELGKSEVVMHDDDTISRFCILHEGFPIVELIYETKFGIGLHPYNRVRKDIDFYYWLSTKVGCQKFYEVYSKELIFIK